MLSKDEKELLTEENGARIDASNLNEENKEDWRNQLFSVGSDMQINNGVISQKQLIKDIMIPASRYSYTISDLDIIRDGGYYQIVIDYPENNISGHNIWMRINGVSSGASYIHSYFAHENGAIGAGTQQSDNRAYCGTIGGAHHQMIINLYLQYAYTENGVRKGIPMWYIEDVGYTDHLYWEKFYGYTVKSTNITSITIMQDNVSIGGTYVRIYRR